MHDIDEMIVRTSKQLPAPAAADHPSSALVVAVAPSWIARRPGRLPSFGVSKQGLPHPQWGLPQPPTTHEAAAAYPAAASHSWSGPLHPKGGATRPGSPPPSIDSLASPRGLRLRRQLHVISVR